MKLAMIFILMNLTGCAEVAQGLGQAMQGVAGTDYDRQHPTESHTSYCNSQDNGYGGYNTTCTGD